MSSIRRASIRWAGGRFLGGGVESAIRCLQMSIGVLENDRSTEAEKIVCRLLETSTQGALKLEKSYCASAKVDPLERMADRLVRPRMRTGMVLS